MPSVPVNCPDLFYSHQNTNTLQNAPPKKQKQKLTPIVFQTDCVLNSFRGVKKKDRMYFLNLEAAE